MSKRALCGFAAVLTVATALAFTVSPAFSAKAPPAPHNAKRALRILHANVTKIARDYRHKRYRAVCADLTARERNHLGGTSSCVHKIAVINAAMPIRKFTITATKFTRHGRQAAVSLYLNGNKKHRIHAVTKWEGGAYRLDSQSGWKPKT